MTLWLHVGLHKTGTTTLQNDFFPALHGIRYLGGKGSRLPVPAREDGRRLIVGLKAVGDRPDAVQAMTALARAWLQRWRLPDRPALLSEEGFSGTWPGNPFDRIAVLPNVLRDMIGDAGIVLVVRDPFSLLVSMYEQRMERQDVAQVSRMYPSDGIPSFDAFLAGERARHDGGGFDTVFGHVLRFDRVVRAYAAAFGRDRVHVLPFEPMASSPDRYCRAWCRLLGIPDQAIDLSRQNASGPERRRRILERFGIAPEDPRAAAFEAQFADLPDRLRADPVIAGYAERHCAPVQAKAAATYAALIGLAPASGAATETRA